MISRYLGKITFDQALCFEDEACARARLGAGGEVLGFETAPVITLGKRSCLADIVAEGEALAKFQIVRVERGGQATLHNPGQLVIFPIFDIHEIGVKAWVGLLLSVGAKTLREFGVNAFCRPGSPGLYTDAGKIVSVGLRIQEGISTHGVALNVNNDLSDFAAIRACGIEKAPMDRIGRETPGAVFDVWMKFFNDELTSFRNLTNLECSLRDVRL